MKNGRNTACHFKTSDGEPGTIVAMRASDDALVFRSAGGHAALASGRGERMLGAMSILAVLRRMEIGPPRTVFADVPRLVRRSGQSHELAEWRWRTR